MTAFTIDFSSITTLSDEQFDRLCADNPEIKFERTPAGELVIMSPTGGETGMNNATLVARFVVWNEQANLGKIFDSSTCFRLPNGGDRSPDVSWVEKSRWDALTPDQQRKFPPLCPDFVLELLSPSDNLHTTQLKMQEYLGSGIRLGWLINPEDQRVEIYRPGQPVEVPQTPSSLSGESVLTGFTLSLDWLWK
ncbi:Uma2 family endonuclease [Synechococcales cyanobacterium C]|uniref:Uma2 family endonuclease n=1 Tax=Petrachloros mirabilis ULC683 TaxID=2781853 RepID=A0A8K2A6M3_9CYAN|nr:Uma2 family endonuclease [Petrachloros mirabilis]NCJ05350.1 Uma2 family endonuclease [Petrachloros mirabilis ULC683]